MTTTDPTNPSPAAPAPQPDDGPNWEHTPTALTIDQIKERVADNLERAASIVAERQRMYELAGDRLKEAKFEHREAEQAARGLGLIPRKPRAKAEKEAGK